MARALHVTRWHANGFLHDDDGLLLDEGVVRVPASDKASTVRAIMDELACPAEAVVSVGDSEMDLSMRVPGSRFIGFCPSRESSHWAFAEAEVEVVHERDLRAILPLLLGAAGAALRAELKAAQPAPPASRHLLHSHGPPANAAGVSPGLSPRPRPPCFRRACPSRRSRRRPGCRPHGVRALSGVAVD